MRFPARLLVTNAAILTAAALLAWGVLAATNEPLPGDYSLVVVDAKDEPLRVYLNEREQWHLPPSNRQPPSNLVAAVTTFEDKRFAVHVGVDPVAAARALYQNVTSGRRVSGASTITMQLARIAGGRRRTLFSKAIESARAVLFELRYTKGEILQLYLDHAPYGSNIVGYQTAARAYFQKPAERLSWAEAATLAVLPNAPGLVAPGASGAALLDRRNELLDKLLAEGYLSESQHAAAMREPVPAGRHAFAVLAPHLADRARRETGRTSGSIATTIDSSIQRELERSVGFHTRYLNAKGVANLAVLVVETKSGAVRGYAGSQDYFDIDAHGQIDGVSAPRSTGSLLKPFLYALAMDEGMLSSESLLEDVPESYGSFAPQNADRRFRGLVTARDALVTSLNVPAAEVLREYGLVHFHSFLNEAGLRHVFRHPDDYGLPLILGGAEATPWEMAGLFRGLATYGEFGEPHYLRGGGGEAPGVAATRGGGEAPGVAATRGGVTSPAAATAGRRRQLVSPGAAYIVLEMLKDVRRPGAEAYWASFREKYPMAWKTGTSYGQRDAWAVGVSPEWTIVVWTGNFTGEENANLRSTTSAGILLFDLFNALPKDPDRAWFEPERHSLRMDEVCLATGYRATPACPETRHVEMPAHAAPLAPCPYHRRIFVTLDERYQVDAASWEPGNYKRVSRLFYPVDVVQYLRENGTIIERVPPYAPGYTSAGSNDLAVIYPDNGARLFLPRDVGGQLQRVTLQAAHRRANTRLFWYLNGTYLGETTRRHVMVPPLEAGEHELVLVDEHGLRAQTSFSVSQARR